MRSFPGRGRWLLLALLVTGAHPAVAQIEALVDIGVRDGPVGGGGTRSHWAIAPSLRYERARLRLTAEGEYRDFGRLGHGLSGAFDGSWFVRIGGPLRGEITTAIRATGGGPTSSAMLWNGGGRVHLAGPTAGLWLGSQAGGGTKSPSFQWDAAAWRRIGNLTFQVQGSQLTLIDRVLREGVAPDTLTPRPDTLYHDQARITTDVAAWLRWTPPRTEVAVALGRRYGISEVAGVIGGVPGDGSGSGLRSSIGRQTTSTWWMLEGTYWLAARWGLTASVGRRPPDNQLRTPGGRFLQFSLRTAVGRGGRTPSARAPAAQREFRVQRIEGEMVELQLVALGTSRVELRGDFTDWRPVEMENRGGGRWRLRQLISIGVHNLSVRYDGGPWVPPPATSVVTDEFGDETGVVVVD